MDRIKREPLSLPSGTICGAVARRGAAREEGARARRKVGGSVHTIEGKGGDVALMPRMQTCARVLGGGEGAMGGGLERTLAVSLPSAESAEEAAGLVVDPSSPCGASLVVATTAALRLSSGISLAERPSKTRKEVRESLRGALRHMGCA